VQVCSCHFQTNIATSATHQARNYLLTIKPGMARVLFALTAVAVILLGYVVRSLLKGYAIRSRMHKLVSDGDEDIRSMGIRD
jgi:hypothetical protein